MYYQFETKCEGCDEEEGYICRNVLPCCRCSKQVTIISQKEIENGKVDSPPIISVDETGINREQISKSISGTRRRKKRV